MKTIKIENSKWQYNSDKIIDYGLHDLLVVLKSDKDEILDKITFPFMRVEIPYNDVPENFILIKPGDMLYIPARSYHHAEPDSKRLSVSIPLEHNAVDIKPTDRAYYKLKL